MRLNNSAFNRYFLAASLIFFIFAANYVYSTWKEYMSRQLGYALYWRNQPGLFILKTRSLLCIKPATSYITTSSYF